MVKQKKPSGVCKLTGIKGVYVKSHIIPQALTRLSKTGEKYVETGIGRRTVRRSTSWYDENSVIRAGEDMLAEIDSAAISMLRKHKLIWSGWSGEKLPLSDDIIDIDSYPIARMLEIEKPEIIILFFQSLLWRAAVSTRDELKDVILDEDIIEDLRLRILNKSPGSYEQYPIQLFQLITKGIEHNRTPLLERKKFISKNGINYAEYTYVRFYFDGLIAYVYLPKLNSFDKNFLSLCIKNENKSVVIIQKFEESRTLENIKTVLEHNSDKSQLTNIDQGSDS